MVKVSAYMKKLTMEDIAKWEPLSKMENATEEVYQERVNGAYNVELPHSKLTLIPYVGEEAVVEYKYPELIALCPVTFLPDTYIVSIRYIPNKYIPELKDLKFYFMDYMKLPISHEHVCSKIFSEFKRRIKPKKLSVKLDVTVRGGIYTTVKLGDEI